MRTRLFTAAVALVAAAAIAGSKAEPELTIYLPRQVDLDGQNMTLGDVAVIRSDRPDLAEQACAIAMGRAPWLKETIVIDRATILSRLASSGFAQDRLQITGADKVTVSRAGQNIAAEDLIASAMSLLSGQSDSPGARYELAGKVQDLRVGPAQHVRLEPSLAATASAGHVKVAVAAMSGQEQLGSAELVFKRQYSVRQAVATADIAPGQHITPQNTKIEMALSDSPQEELQLPFGMQATRHIAAGSAIRPGMAASAKAQPIIDRDQTVVMKIEGAGFVVTAVGQAMENGRVGQFIRIRNIDTKRMIVAQVAQDGTVRPVVQNEVSK